MRKVLGGGGERNGKDTKATTQMFGHDESAAAWVWWSDPWSDPPHPHRRLPVPSCPSCWMMPYFHFPLNPVLQFSLLPIFYYPLFVLVCLSCIGLVMYFSHWRKGKDRFVGSGHDLSSFLSLTAFPRHLCFTFLVSLCPRGSVGM